ncbi:MAG: hypothetical protein EOO01_45155 [Chitinophagaceae bacterium]|nr:MAG: hypothetical protein EOO01_45155 [Chitinophagaceae bacterium]
MGDTSVHAFTEAGSAINVMIKIFLFGFAGLGLYLFFRHYKRIPTIHTEEATNSREFWMFIGSIVFFLSAIFIIAVTSIPVYNKIPVVKDLISKFYGGAMAMPEDPEFLYNKVMVLVAFILGMLTAIAQYFKYKKSDAKTVIKKIAVPTIVAAVLTALITIVYPFTFYKHGAGFLIAIYLAFFAAIYAVVANAMYIFTAQKGRIKLAGGSIAHLGFSLMLVGMLISSSNKQVISSSLVNGITFPSANKDPMTKEVDDPQENLTLIRQVPTKMAAYELH